MLNLTIKRLDKFVTNSIFDGSRMNCEKFISMHEGWLGQLPETAQVLEDIKEGKEFPHPGLVKILSIMTEDNNSSLIGKVSKAKFNSTPKYKGVVLSFYRNSVHVSTEEYKDLHTVIGVIKNNPDLEHIITDYRHKTPIKINL